MQTQCFSSREIEKGSDTLNNKTQVQNQDSISCKKLYQTPAMDMYPLGSNDVIPVSNPDDRGEWDVNPTQPGGNR